MFCYVDVKKDRCVGKSYLAVEAAVDLKHVHKSGLHLVVCCFLEQQVAHTGLQLSHESESIKRHWTQWVSDVQQPISWLRLLETVLTLQLSVCSVPYRRCDNPLFGHTLREVDW